MNNRSRKKMAHIFIIQLSSTFPAIGREKYRDYANVPRNDPFPIIARIPLGFFVGPREIDMKSDLASR